jgi:hypothetical protein
MVYANVKTDFNVYRQVAFLVGRGNLVLTMYQNDQVSENV